MINIELILYLNVFILVVIIFQGKKLNIPSVTVNDTGIYRCLADNTIRPPATQDVMLTVYFQPYAEPVQSKYGQAQNRMFDIVIECWIQGKVGIQSLFKYPSQFCYTVFV